MKRFISIADLKAVKGIQYSRPHLYRLIAAGRFPRLVHLSENRVAFLESEIDAWIDAQVAARDEVA